MPLEPVRHLYKKGAFFLEHRGASSGETLLLTFNRGRRNLEVLEGLGRMDRKARIVAEVRAAVGRLGEEGAKRGGDRGS